MDDISIVGQSLQMTLIGFREAKNAYENGTKEVRRLLMEECSLIYECHICRNLFRNLANFITHKRMYCKQYSQQYFHKKYDPHSTVIIQKNQEQNRDNEVNELKIFNSYAPFEEVNAQMKVSCTNEKQSGDKKNNKSPILELEDVPATTQAVYQTVKLQPTDNIKTELEEVRNMLNENAVLGPDGKALNNEFQLNDFNIKQNGVDKRAAFPCDLCHLTFQTEKTLNVHFQKKHNSSAYVFQCPLCSLTFLQPAAVIRHLSNEHKKPMKHIRKMRDVILRKRLQMSDINVHAQVKGASRELKRLQLNDNAKDEKHSEIGNNSQLNQKNKLPISVCTYCKKTFERRAVLSAHLQNCSVKKTLNNSSSLHQSTSVTTTGKRLTVLPLKVLQERETSVSNSNKLSKNFLKQDDMKIKNEIEHIENQRQELTNLNVHGNKPQADVASLDEMFENLEKTDFGKGLQTLTFDKLAELMTMDDNNSNGLMVTPNKTNQVKINEEDDVELLQNQLVTSTKTAMIILSPSPSTSTMTLLAKDESNDKDPLMVDSLENSIEKKSETKKSLRLVDPSKQLTCRCKICNKQFNALSNLRRHISLFHYRARRFGCTLCEYRAFRRYDIVNHLVSVHKMTTDREIMATEYVSVHEVNYSKDDVESDILVVSNESNSPAKQSAVKEEKQKLQQPKNIANKRKYRSHSVTYTNSSSATLNGNLKMAKRRLRKTSNKSVSGQKSVDAKFLQRRPIRNRIKPEKKDFLYDMAHLPENNRVILKRRNTMLGDNKDILVQELTPPPIKIVPYRLRTEPLLPANKAIIKGHMDKIYRKQVTHGLAAPSTVPELPTERPFMRPRLISTCRNDFITVPVIETSELEAVRLKAATLEDSFLEKLAKRANTSFRMKPLLSMKQPNPLNTILQKFDSSLQLNHSDDKSNVNNVKANTIENGITSSTVSKLSELSELQDPSLPLSSTDISIFKPSHSITDITKHKNKTETSSLKNILNVEQQQPQFTEITPNGKYSNEISKTPFAPKKRISLMQRLVENRKKRRKNVLNATLQE